MDWKIIAFISVFLIVAAFAMHSHQEAKKAEEARKRKEYLVGKYGNGDLVEDLINGIIRQGMTEEMVVDSWGPPVDVDERVFKTKTSRTFKYHQTGRNQFASRVKLENGIVVGWKQR